jgi:hypothetical protein
MGFVKQSKKLLFGGFRTSKPSFVRLLMDSYTISSDLLWMQTSTVCWKRSQ